MAKKKFLSGLDDLFADEHDSVMGGSISEVTVRRSPERKGPSGVKSFASNLDALFQEAFDDSFDRLEQGRGAADKNAKSKTQVTAQEQERHDGLDALIRQTVDIQDFSSDEDTGIKRLTVAVQRAKLEKLKKIARLENAYLKDLLSGLIDEYIQGYSEEKGMKFE